MHAGQHMLREGHVANLERERKKQSRLDSELDEAYVANGRLAWEGEQEQYRVQTLEGLANASRGPVVRQALPHTASAPSLLPRAGSARGAAPAPVAAPVDVPLAWTPLDE